MPLAIHFISRAGEDDGVALGEIIINDFAERFEVPLHYWSRDDYERQWNDALSRLMEGASKACFMTSAHNPSTCNFMVAWPVYREGDRLFIQNHLLFMDQVGEGFDPAVPYRFIRDRRTTNEDGERISEWVCDV